MTTFLALMILDALALWAIVASRKGWWSLKTLAIVVALAFNFLTLHAFSSGDGWPTKGNPTNALFLACDVVEGNPQSGFPGAIYIFATPLKQQHHLFGYSSPQQAPRIYQEPYSRQLHEACVQAQKRQQHGVQQMVGRKGPVKGKKGNQLNTGKVVFYNLPPSMLPKK